MKKIFTTLAFAAMTFGMANAEAISTPIYLYIQTTAGVTAADEFETVISYENGVYTIEDFLATETPLSFTLEENPVLPEDSETSYAKYPMTLVGDNLYAPYGDHYLRMKDEDGNYIAPTFYNCDNDGEFYDELKLYYFTINSNQASGWYWGDYTYEEDGTYPWTLTINCYGYTDLSTWATSDWFTVKLFIDNMAKAAGVNEIATERGAAEYYNLQGVRVANPENGLFIKAENGKTTKVIM